MRRAALLPALLFIAATTACKPKPSLTMGRVTEGSLDSTDQVSLEGPWEDHWTFDGTRGQRLRIEMRSSDLDAFLRLQGPDHQLLASNDDALGRDAAITIKLPANGRYTVIATSYGREKTRGTYRVGANLEAGTFADPGTIGTVAIGQSVDGVLEVGDSTRAGGAYADYFTFTPAADTVVQLDLVSTQFDTYLDLQDSTGVTLGSDDDSGESTNARLTFAVTHGTRYRIAATSYGSSARSGTYRLTAAYGRPKI